MKYTFTNMNTISCFIKQKNNCDFGGANSQLISINSDLLDSFFCHMPPYSLREIFQQSCYPSLGFIYLENVIAFSVI